MKCAYALATPYGVTGASGVASFCGLSTGSPKIRLDELDALADAVQGLVGARARPDDADNVDSLADQELREVRAILTSDAGDERAPHPHSLADPPSGPIASILVSSTPSRFRRRL